jgi:hypothetical protein
MKKMGMVLRTCGDMRGGTLSHHVLAMRSLEVACRRVWGADDVRWQCAIWPSLHENLVFSGRRNQVLGRPHAHGRFPGYDGFRDIIGAWRCGRCMAERRETVEALQLWSRTRSQNRGEYPWRRHCGCVCCTMDCWGEMYGDEISRCLAVDVCAVCARDWFRGGELHFNLHFYTLHL